MTFEVRDALWIRRTIQDECPRCKPMHGHESSEPIRLPVPDDIHERTFADRYIGRFAVPNERAPHQSQSTLSMHLLAKTRSIAAAAFCSLLPLSALAADCVNGINTAACTAPAGAVTVLIEAWGAGGGGGGAANAGGAFDGGGGGGGGSYCRASFAVAGGTALTVNAGAGGAAGLFHAAGGPGSPSSVTGAGIAGLVANGGFAGAPNGLSGAGGTAAACTAAAGTSFAGGDGAASSIGGGGGGSATTTAVGGNGVGGAGGAGTGAGGSGGAITSNDGLPGGAPGGGGGGGYDLGGRAGGAGGAGQVRMAFTVVAMAAPAAIPALQDWGMGLLSALLALAAWGTLRKKI